MAATVRPVDYSYPWIPDEGNGRYRNPILHADYSDPDVIRHGDDFWMTASSFNCTPGLPILHSRDLVNWTLVNHALENVPGERYREVQPGCGVWAPSMRFHAGKFWIFFPTPDEGIYVTTATEPRGQWTEPHPVQSGKGLIDPCPLWDDDGKAYLVHAFAGSRAGIKHRLRVCPMAPDGSSLLGEGQIVFHEPERHPTIEGPKFLKRDGWYYILAPAGGVTKGWQTVLRSRNIYGPYEDRIVLHQGGTDINGPHQGALVDGPDATWWFVHFQDVGICGRIVHLQPVTWQDEWPVMGLLGSGQQIGEPVREHKKPVLIDGSILVPATSDEFDVTQLGRQWQWHANHQPGWCSLIARKDWLRLYAQPHGQSNPGVWPQQLLQKFPARSFTVQTMVEFCPKTEGDEAGLVVAGDASAALSLRKHGESCQLVLNVDGAVRFETGPIPSRAILQVQVAPDGICRFASTVDRHTGFIPFEFRARAGRWIGAKVGLFARQSGNDADGGYADFDYFRFS